MPGRRPPPRPGRGPAASAAAAVSMRPPAGLESCPNLIRVEHPAQRPVWATRSLGPSQAEWIVSRPQCCGRPLTHFLSPAHLSAARHESRQSSRPAAGHFEYRPTRSSNDRTPGRARGSADSEYERSRVAQERVEAGVL